MIIRKTQQLFLSRYEICMYWGLDRAIYYRRWEYKKHKQWKYCLRFVVNEDNSVDLKCSGHQPFPHSLHSYTVKPSQSEASLASEWKRGWRRRMPPSQTPAESQGRGSHRNPRESRRARLTTTVPGFLFISHQYKFIIRFHVTYYGI